jgi:hypothetical protein
MQNPFSTTISVGAAVAPLFTNFLVQPRLCARLDIELTDDSGNVAAVAIGGPSLNPTTETDEYTRLQVGNTRVIYGAGVANNTDLAKLHAVRLDPTVEVKLRVTAHYV